jgi:hypothetical protein
MRSHVAWLGYNGGFSSYSIISSSIYYAVAILCWVLIVGIRVNSSERPEDGSR